MFLLCHIKEIVQKDLKKSEYGLLESLLLKEIAFKDE